jgi:hypothetical protein
MHSAIQNIQNGFDKKESKEKAKQKDLKEFTN